MHAPLSALKCTALAALAALDLMAPAAAETYAWTQYTPAGLEARAVTDQAACPAATLDGAAAPMHVRSAPGNKYPVTVCALTIPAAAKALTVADAPVALAAVAPKRIAVIGDTGCRLKGQYIQACNDPAQWPFKELATRLAAQKPDLIIHVGDYHYRETACPAGDAGCAGSPFGDNWDVWRADFFAPAAALLPVAPWVTVRGNHEDCERGGRGWSRLLEPMAYDAATGCNGPSPAYVVQLPKVALALVDTALADEARVNAAQADWFRPQYESLAKLATGPIWLLQHRPIWSVGGTVAGFPFGDNKTLALAARTTLPRQVELMLSGHHHIFQAVNYVEDLPPQIISGHGGDFLNPGRSSNPAGWSINGVTVKSGLHEVGTFGYAMIEPQDDGWVITNYDVAGKALQRCGLKSRQLGCISEATGK